MPTPTNSILNREMSEAARMSQLIYDNESLRIEVETLQEQLNASGALDVVRLRETNERLANDVRSLTIQLEEKVSKLSLYENSDEKFSNIDVSLKELLAQLHEQRAELAAMRTASTEKDDYIQGLTAQLQTAVEEKERMQHQLQQAKDVAATTSNQGNEVLRQAEERICVLEEEVKSFEGKARRLEAEAADSKEAAEARSLMTRERTAAQQQVLADLREAEAEAQRRATALEADNGQLEDEVAQLRKAMETLRERLQDTQAQAQAPAVVAPVSLRGPEVRAHVEKMVKEAVADRDVRLREQVEQNASLLARIAIIQQESAALVQNAGLSDRELKRMNERVDFMSKCKSRQNGMQRRVDELLSSDTFSKKDVEQLLQEMLDYQEDVSNETSTQLLIKDLQSEEAEKTFRWNMKRLENENVSLLKQLQRAAFTSLQRNDAAGGAQDNNNNNNNNDLHTPQRRPATSAADYSPQAQPAGQVARPGGGAAARQTSASASGGSIMCDLWERTPSQQSPQNASAGQRYSPPPQSGHRAPQRQQQHMDPAAANMRTVACPACTFEQRLSNGICEICEAPLTA